jgi:putative transposase
MASFISKINPTHFIHPRWFGFCDQIISSINQSRRSKMNKPLHPQALFRLSVLGPLASRNLERGEAKKIIRELSAKTFNIPNSKRVHLSEPTILRWYTDWRRGGIEALCPISRNDQGKTKLSDNIQTAVLQFKKENPARSINTIIKMCEKQGFVAKNELSRSTVHRFLQNQKLSKRTFAESNTIERRSFVAEHAGDIWHGDVLHGPKIQTPNGFKKTYLVSLLDDKSRLLTHSAFCLGETALDVEGILKQALLKRGIPYKLIIDNGSAYRSESLQTICALLEIKLVYCRPYEPEGKGKLERFHRTFRESFLGEIDLNKITNLDDLNARLWAWCEQVYHCQPHGGLNGKTPLDCWREDLVQVRPLGLKAERIDDLFCHRYPRTVRKDGTVSWEGRYFEVPYALVNKKIILVVDPHTKSALRVESFSGENLGSVTPLNKHANLDRKRQRPNTIPVTKHGTNLVELAYQEHSQIYGNLDLNKSGGN